MTINLEDIEMYIGLKLKGPVKWGQTIPSQNEGIYIVVTPNKEPTKIIFSKDIITLWVEKVPDMKVGKENPTYDNLCNELKKFWFDDEIVLYAGKTVQPIKDRVNQYYQTKIGDKGPHSGGYWIKTLEFLDECLVFWVECNNPELVEENILKYFHSRLSKEKISKKSIFLPFANLKIDLLEEHKTIKKQHILKKSRI